ncbi:MAG: prepilin-type N-terminal cleavage/methylation domain-containing protein [Candidatus Tectomicrobia bacterium]|uniref:Prepilin-type N-terminal cleavage/methylation domain-containing protein n=1 Tax=Tectimicrobiota bacterium TaxID=2528274 RepID=A0A932CLH0_UNCTE|nr:prepilin-type N-terminal cleavage/methylation domain-containing protein [Candidatus Tectomicrobia bacterium]
MLKDTRNVLREQRGFTLVELMVVLIVIAVLAAVAVPLYTGYVNQARANEAVQGIGAIAQAAESRRAAIGTYPGTLTVANYITVAGTANFAYAYDGSGANPTVTATGQNDLAGTDTIVCTLRAGQKPLWSGTGTFAEFVGP